VALSTGAIFDPYSSALQSDAAKATVSTNKAYIRDALGWNVLLAQNLGDFQIAARYELFDPNTDVSASDVGVLANTSIADVAWTQISGAVSYNLSSNVKFMVEYDHKANETIGKAFVYKAGSDNRNYTTDVNNDKTTFQLQYKF
jgi:opacity protein-like surface antigen